MRLHCYYTYSHQRSSEHSFQLDMRSVDKFRKSSDKTISISVSCWSKASAYIVADVDGIASYSVVIAGHDEAHAWTRRNAHCAWSTLGPENAGIDKVRPSSRVWDVAIRRHDLLFLRWGQCEKQHLLHRRRLTALRLATLVMLPWPSFRCPKSFGSYKGFISRIFL